VHYPEECFHCAAKFLRITHTVIGNPNFPTGMPTRIESQDFEIMQALIPAAERLAAKLNLPLGPFHGEVATVLYSARPTSQSCPQCGCVAPDALVSDGEAAMWPHREAHFRFSVPPPGKGWMPALAWNVRPTGDSEQWDALVNRRRQEREQAREAARRKREKKRQLWEAEAAERKRKAEKDRAREEMERKAREEAWQREEREKRAQEHLRQSEKRRDALASAAEKVIKDARLRELWLNTSNPSTKLRHPVVFAAESEANLQMAMQALEGAVRR
jgi:hypothetical protein